MSIVFAGENQNNGIWDWFQDNQGWTYLANGVDQPQVWDGISATSRNWGLPAMTAAVTFNAFVGGGVLTGIYYYYAVLYNSATDTEGGQGPISASMTAAAQNITVNRPAGATTLDPQATHWRLYRNTAGQATTFYKVADVPTATATYTDAITDVALSAGSQTLNLTNMKLRMPAQHPYVALHGGFAFGWGGKRLAGSLLTMTNGSPNVTGTGFSQAMVGMRFRITSPAAETKVYTVLSVTSATALVLTENYTGTNSPPTKSAMIYPANDDLASWSIGGRYEEFRLFNGASVGAGDGGVPTGIFTLLDALYLAKDRSLYRWNFTTNPNPLNGDAGIFNVLRNRGLLNHRCRVVVGPHAYMLDRKGVYRFSGDYEENQIDRQIHPLLLPSYMPGNRRVNWSAAANFHAVHDPKEDRIVFFMAIDQDLEPRHAFCYDRRRDRWHVEQYDSGVTASLQMRDLAGVDRVFIGDEHGYVRGFGVNPGLDAGARYGGAARTVRGTITGIAANSLTDAAANFGGAGTMAEHAGSWVEVYEGVGAGQTRRIGNAVSATVLTLAPGGWATTPAVGDKYRIGPVEMILETQNMAMAPLSPNELKEARFLRVFFEPREDWPESWIGITLFKDWSLDPFLGWSPRARANGLEIPSSAKIDGELRAYVDNMTGCVQVTLGHEYARAWRVKLRYKDGNRPIPITGLEIAGAVVPRQDWRDQ